MQHEDRTKFIKNEINRKAFSFSVNFCVFNYCMNMCVLLLVVSQFL